MAIIVLKTADFSANNIGTIDINREPMGSTLALLSNYALYVNGEVSKKSQLALDDFLIDLKASTIWDKVDMMLIPYFASDRTEMLFNLKTGTTVKYSINQANFDVFSKKVGKGMYYDSRKLASFSYPNNPGFYQPIIDISGYGLSTENIHMSAYLPEKLSSAKNVIGDYETLGVLSTRTFSSGKYSIGYLTAEADTNTILSTGFRIGTCAGNTMNDINIYSCGQTKYNTTLTKTMNRSEASRIGLFCNTPSDATVDVTIGLFSVGKALTDAECSIYTTLVNTLMNVLMAN